MRLLAIDFGEKRVGLAISDETGGARPLATLDRSTDKIVAAQIAQKAKELEVTELILGEPRNASGGAAEWTERVRRFAVRLERRVRLPLSLVDESLTSHEAEQRLRSKGIDPRREPGRVDALAAAILLEGELARRQREELMAGATEGK